MDNDHPQPAATRIAIGVVLGLSLLILGLIALHAPYANGPWYWKWRWRRLPAAPYFPLMLAGAAPIVVAGLATRRLNTAGALTLMMAGVLAMKVASRAVLTSPPSLHPIGEFIEDRDATSYYTDAAAIASSPGWLAQYPQIIALPQINLHTRNKPAGPVAYFVAIVHLFGHNHQAAIFAGLLLGALATLSIPALYWLTKLLVGDHVIALRAAFLLCLCPGFIFFFPMFDPIYVALACVMLGLWHLALRSNDVKYPIALGAALMMATFVTYNVLVLGAFMLGYAFLVTPAAKPGQIVRQGAIAFAVCVLAYLMLWAVTGYDPIATFRQGIANHEWQLAKYAHDRPYPWTILFDLTDFALGAGWVVPLLAIGAVLRQRGPLLRLFILCLAQVMLVAVIALLQSETARVWNFMLPLVIIPAGVELARWPQRARMSAYLVILLLLLAVGQNMSM